MSWWRRRSQPLANAGVAAASSGSGSGSGSSLPCARRIVPMTAAALSDHLLLNSLKMHEYAADASLEDPVGAAAWTAASSDAGGEAGAEPPLRVGTLDDSGLPTVPSDLGEEIRELLGATEEALPADADAAAAASVPLPAPELPSSSAAALLARSGAMPPSRRTSAVLASLEGAEVRVLGSARLPLAVVYATALARLAAIAPPGHYRGPLGALRRTRLWWRVHGMAVAVGAACVVLGAGVVALCVFVPIVGIIVVANVILIAGVGGTVSRH